jgi:radical SAM-linked protein
MALDGLLDLESHYPQLSRESLSMPALPAESPHFESCRYIASYRKTGLLKYASHLDLIRLLSRTFYRAGIQLKHSQGFHPKPLFSFGPALSVGKESLAEWMEFDCYDTFVGEEFLERINAKAPEGLHFVTWQQVPAEAPPLSQLIDSAEYSAWPNAASLNGVGSEEVACRIAELLAQDSLEIIRQKQERIKTVNIRPGIIRLSVEPEGSRAWFLRLFLSTGPTNAVRPEEVLSTLLGSCGHPWKIRRDCLGKYQNEMVNPLDLLNPYRIGAEISLHVKRANCQQQFP